MKKREGSVLRHSSLVGTLRSEGLLLTASLILQIGLGLLLGHAYDMRINMATGVLVGTGQNPYIAQDLSLVFQNRSFQAITSIGYPPPWPLVLGLIYSLTYKFIPNFLIYNLAIKLPVIAANLCLAYLVRNLLSKLGSPAGVSRKAWIFLLFNPFFLYATAAWGQFDSIVALLSLLSLVLLFERKVTLSALLLALAISLKPIALPLIPAVILFLHDNPIKVGIRYALVFLSSCALLFVAPFILFHWDPAPILQHWNFHFSVGGGLSSFTLLELLQGSNRLPGLWWLAGLLWIPALILTAISVKRAPASGLIDLLRISAVLILVFFLSRTWLSEPNIILLLPLVVILASRGLLRPWLLTAAWLIALVFSIFNTAAVQLLFPSSPVLMEQLMSQIGLLGTSWWILRTLMVVIWFIAGIWIVRDLIKARVVDFDAA